MEKPHKMFNLNRISEMTGISREKVYMNMGGDRDTLTDDQKNEIFSILDEALSEVKKIVKP